MDYNSIDAVWYSMLSFSLKCVVVANCLFLLFISVQKRHHSIPFREFSEFAFCIAIWNLFKGICYVIPSVESAVIFEYLLYIGVATSSVTYFIFCFTYSFQHKAYLKKKFRLLYIVPAVTVLMIAIPPLRSLFLVYTGEVKFFPRRQIEMAYGPWFTVHSLWSYSLVLAGTASIAIKTFRPHTRNRKSCIIFFITSLIFIGYNVLFTIRNDLDTLNQYASMLTHLLMIDVFFAVLMNDESEHIVYSGQQNMIAMMPFPVFVLGKRDEVLYSNFQANLFIPPELKRNKAVLWDDIISNFLLEKMVLPAENEIVNMVRVRQGNMSFFLNEKDLVDDRNRKKGKLVMLVTQAAFSALFKELQARAFNDVLTGCFNRHYLEVKKTDLQTDAAMPLSFLLCDIDGLKHVNDTFGHDAGDEYILLCANAIRSCIRTTDYVFRLGGDEFLVILPRVTRETAEDVIKKISLELEIRSSDLKYHADLSIGMSIANSVPVDFSAQMKAADESMYMEKQRHHSERGLV